MCGIFAYTGTKEAEPILIDGLTRLEYRGYDSAGIYLKGGEVVKTKGAIQELKSKLVGKDFEGATSGIGHLRWATHGEPNETNAHPHTESAGSVFVVHNGIIENYKTLRERLSSEGYVFQSETDSEVLPALIHAHMKVEGSFEDAVMAALKEVRGTYGIVCASREEPDVLIAARMGAPVVVGVGDGEYFVSSDATPIIRHTKEVIFLQDGDVAVLTPQSYRVRTHEVPQIERVPEHITWNADEASKGGYPHFMLKEIYEAPEVIENALRGRAVPGLGEIKLGGLEPIRDILADAKRVVFAACGTSYYASLIGEYLFEDIARIPVEVEYASEFRYRNPVIEEGTVLIALSQSGETADTLEAVREAKKRGALTLGVVNSVGSSIARETDAGVYNHAGPEIGVASTKAFISQVVVLALIALYIGRMRDVSREEVDEFAETLKDLPHQVEKLLQHVEKIEQIAEKYADMRDFLFIGRRYSFPVALEGALKLKEISYIHAEGYGAGEMKHGPLAMIDELFPTLAIAPSDSVYEKTVSNMIEIKARKGPIVAIATEGDAKIQDVADDVIYIPKTREKLSAILSAIAVQLFAYYVGVSKGYNIDRPRNLAKSVTVE